MTDINAIQMNPNKYMIFHKAFKQIPHDTMQRVITQKIGFKWATVMNIIPGGDEWVYLIERQYE